MGQTIFGNQRVALVTRSVDFRQVKLYLNKSFDKEMELNLIKRYFDRKIDGYKVQDKRALREIDGDNYITAQWCMDRFKGCCGKCNVKFEFDTHHGQLCSNFTAQRVENELGHATDNCESWCKYCNCSAC